MRKVVRGGVYKYRVAGKVLNEFKSALAAGKKAKIDIFPGATDAEGNVNGKAVTITVTK